MRRVVVTGLGIVSSIGSNAEEVRASLHDAKSGISFSELVRRARLPLPGVGRADARPRAADRPPRAALPVEGRPVEPCRHAAGDRRRRTGRRRHLQRAHRHRHGLRRSVHTHHRRSLRDDAEEQQSQTRRSVCGAEGDVVHRVRHAGDLVQDPRRQLFDLVGLLDLGALHRQRLRAHPVGQAGHDVRRRPRGSRLDACRTCSTRWARCRRNSTTAPRLRSRAYDVDRDGFVIAGGAGVLVLEELEHAKARGAKIYAEIVGYGATSDGYDMVAPSGEGAARCMRQAIATVSQPIDYINTHGTSTPVGDSKEMAAIREVFGDKMPYITSTKSLTGHSLGGAGVQEIDLFDPDDAGPFHRRKRPYREPRPGIRRHADREEAHRQRQDRHRAVEFLRLRRHQCDAGLPAPRRVGAAEWVS